METTTIEITKETHELLRRYADIHGFRISHIGDKILRDFLQKEKLE